MWYGKTQGTSDKHFLTNMRPFEAQVFVQAAANCGYRLSIGPCKSPTFENYVGVFSYDRKDKGGVFAEYERLMALTNAQQIIS